MDHAARGAGGRTWGRGGRTRGPPQLSGSGPINPRKGVWTDVGALADFDEGRGKLVHAGAVSAFVFRRGEAVSAVSAICSHLPCELWWDGEQSLLACPCHPVWFTPEGKPKSKYPMPSLNEVKARTTADERVEVLGT